MNAFVRLRGTCRSGSRLRFSLKNSPMTNPLTSNTCVFTGGLMVSSASVEGRSRPSQVAAPNTAPPVVQRSSTTRIARARRTVLTRATLRTGFAAGQGRPAARAGGGRCMLVGCSGDRLRLRAHWSEVQAREDGVRATRPSVDEQMRLLAEGTVDVLPADELRAKLRRALETRRPLRVKQGFDPTAPDIHLGHAVGLRKLRQFQELGHTVVLIVGDHTGLIGDPSGVSKTRPQLDAEQLEANAQTYLAQFGRVVDLERAEVRRNGEWLAPLRYADVVRITSA